MNTLICFAIKEEAAAFQKMAAGKSSVSILTTGIGRKNADKSLRQILAANSPGRVLTCGFTGGLDPELKLGDIVFELPPGSPASLREQLVAVGAKSAKFVCVDRIAVTVEEKKKLRADTGADAVEMESAAIHAVCAERGIPCATLRVISDTANDNLPLDFNQFADADMNLDFGKLMFAVMKSPGKIGALMELRKVTTAAAEKLAAVLARLT